MRTYLFIAYKGNYGCHKCYSSVLDRRTGNCNTFMSELKGTAPSCSFFPISLNSVTSTTFPSLSTHFQICVRTTFIEKECPSEVRRTKCLTPAIGSFAGANPPFSPYSGNQMKDTNKKPHNAKLRKYRWKKNELFVHRTIPNHPEKKLWKFCIK